MMETVKIKSYITKGIKAVPVEVFVSVTDGIGIHLVGLQDSSVKEVLLRTTTALMSLGYRVPGKKIVIVIKSSDNLPVTCCASNLDLPVAVGILAASGQWKEIENLSDIAIVGELGLDGTVREVRSEYTIALAADKVIIPKVNAARLADKPGVLDQHKVYVASNINDALYALKTPDAFDINNVNLHDNDEQTEPDKADFKYVSGADLTRRALEIAAAGGHSINLIGGYERAYLIRCLRSILPPMSEEEYIETEKIMEAQWVNTSGKSERPIQYALLGAGMMTALVGGGPEIKPGEVSLAHNGILVLDEFNYWPDNLLKALKPIVEDRKVRISRLREAIEYPANFILVGKSWPCHCGGHRSECRCSEAEREVFAETIANKGRNLFDVTHWVGPFRVFPEAVGVDSATIRKRVIKARRMQAKRLAGTGIEVNGKLNDKLTEKFCILPDEIQRNLEVRLVAETQENINERLARVKRVARTIADLDESENIDATHVLEALSYFTTT